MEQRAGRMLAERTDDRGVPIGVDELIEEVGIEPDRVSQVVDYYHATERLAKGADLRVSWKKKEREQWLKRVITKLWKGDIDAVLAECRALSMSRLPLQEDRQVAGLLRPE